MGVDAGIGRTHKIQVIHCIKKKLLNKRLNNMTVKNVEKLMGNQI